jgi:hypothetical protein
MQNQFTIPVSELDVDTRATFITRTYTHLFGAILFFAGLEAFYFTSGFADVATEFIFSFGSIGWLVALGAFMLVGTMASSTAHKVESPLAQYTALAGYVIAQSLMFIPLLWMANQYSGGEMIHNAALVTLFGFASLTAIAFFTRKDFSFLKGILFWGGICAIILIVVGALMGFNLGLYFSIGMVALAGGYILYTTSNIIHHYPENKHVAASLELFSAVALMFWYVLRIFMSRR